MKYIYKIIITFILAFISHISTAQVSETTSGGNPWNGIFSADSITTESFVFDSSEYEEVYQFLSQKNHFYTTNFSEINLNEGEYQYEGARFFVGKNHVTGTIPLYRYFHHGVNNHFYSTNFNELGFGIHGYNFEGIVGFVHATPGEGRLPLYRYYNPFIFDHFLTTSSEELAGGNSGWLYEGIIGYVYPYVKPERKVTFHRIEHRFFDRNVFCIGNNCSEDFLISNSSSSLKECDGNCIDIEITPSLPPLPIPSLPPPSKEISDRLDREDAAKERLAKNILSFQRLGVRNIAKIQSINANTDLIRENPELKKFTDKFLEFLAIDLNTLNLASEIRYTNLDFAKIIYYGDAVNNWVNGTSKWSLNIDHFNRISQLDNIFFQSDQILGEYPNYSRKKFMSIIELDSRLDFKEFNRIFTRSFKNGMFSEYLNLGYELDDLLKINSTQRKSILEASLGDNNDNKNLLHAKFTGELIKHISNTFVNNNIHGNSFDKFPKEQAFSDKLYQLYNKRREEDLILGISEEKTIETILEELGNLNWDYLDYKGENRNYNDYYYTYMSLDAFDNYLSIDNKILKDLDAYLDSNNNSLRFIYNNFLNEILENLNEINLVDFEEALEQGGDDLAEFLEAMELRFRFTSSTSREKLQSVFDSALGKGAIIIDDDGVVKLNISRESLSTEEQKAFFDLIEEATDPSKPDTVIRVYESDGAVVAGSFSAEKIDIDDIIMFEEGHLGANQMSILGHEIFEQFEKQANDKDRPASHSAAEALEEKLNGGYIRIEDDDFVGPEPFKVIDGGRTYFTRSGTGGFNYTNGETTINVKYIVEEGNIIQIIREEE